jgi:predicted phage terminase large subunit-like protein
MMAGRLDPRRTSSKSSQLSDYSVCTTWGGVKGKKAYLLHVLRRKMEYPELKATVISHAKAWKAPIVLIEDKASGSQLIQELTRAVLPEAKGIKPTGDNVMRMQARTAHLENGCVLLPERAPWSDEYISELTTFPQARDDD